MGYVVKMPKLGLEMEQGTILEWHASEGDTVEEDEVIVEVESEKSIGEVEARENGVLRLIGLEEDNTVSPGTPIGIVAGADEDITELEAELNANDGSTEATETDSGKDETAATSSESPGEENDASKDASRNESADVKASPRAEHRAEELGVELARVDGSGPQGAITADDIEAAADTQSGAETASEQVRASPRAERRADELGVDLTTVDGSGPQGAITVDDVENSVEDTSEKSTIDESELDITAEEQVTAIGEQRYQTTTFVTHGDEADTLVEATDMASNAFDFDVSTIDVFLLAISAALDDHPEFNATFENNTHHLHEDQDIVLTVEDAGDIDTVVVSDLDKRSFTDLVETRSTQAEQAAAGNITGKRATFAVANRETTDEVEKAIQPPAVAGLLINSSYQRTVPAENGVTFRRYLRLSLAYDSRAIGDRDVRAFLDTLIECIQELPELILRSYQSPSKN